MSLYDESMAVTDYRQMLKDIEHSRELLKAKALVEHSGIDVDDYIKQNPDTVYWHGRFWRAVSLPGAPIPVFHVVTILKSRKQPRDIDGKLIDPTESKRDSLLRSSQSKASQYFDSETVQMLKANRSIDWKAFNRRAKALQGR